MTGHAVGFVLLALFAVVEPSLGLAEVVAAKTLRKGAILNVSDLNATTPESEVLKDSLVGAEIKKSVFVGRKITESDVGPVTIVFRNDIVKLVFSLRGLGLRTEARALGSGGIGETIQVMNLDTRVTVTAKVVGQKRAEVVK